MSQRSQRKPSNILESDKEHANTTSKGKNNWKKKPQSQDRARKNRSNYIHEKSLKKIKKKKTSNGLVKLPGYDTVLVREIHVCVFCLGGQRQELNYAACTRAEFLFCVSKKIWLWGYTYIFLLCGSSQHMHSILAAPEPLKFGLVLDYCFVYLTQRDKAISIQQVWCSFKHWVLGRDSPPGHLSWFYFAGVNRSHSQLNAWVILA